MAKFPLGICLMFMITTSTIYEVQGHFLLDHYMKKIPKISSEFEPFAFKGILSFIDHLEGLCPLKVEYKEFFTKLKDFMAFINSASGSSAEFHTQLKTKSEELFKAITKMGGTAGASAHTTKLIESLVSMGKTLAEYKRSGSQTLTSEQRTELVTSMSRWAQTIGQFVKSVTETNGGGNIDLKSLGCGGATGISTSMETGSTATGSTSMETGSTGGSGSPSGDTGSPSAETGSPAGSESGSPSNETPAEGGSGSPSGSPSDSSSGAGSTGSETSAEAESTAGAGSGAGAGETPGAAGLSGSPTDSPSESEESSKDESSKDESSKDESSKDESSKDESSKDESSKDESSKDDSSKDENSKDESSKDESSKDESSKDESSKDDSSKDESSKDESSKDESSKDESSKDESSKDESSKDESSKDESSKGESSKDESSKGESSAESGESSKEASGGSSTETQSETGAESGSTAGGPSGEPSGDAGAPSGSTSDMSAGGASASGGASETSTQTSAEGESSMNSGGSYADTTGGSAEGSASSPSGSASGSSETSSITGSENSSYQAGGSSAGGPSGSTTEAAGSTEGGSGASVNQSVKGKVGATSYEERFGLYRLQTWSSHHHSSIRLISKRTFPQRLAVRMSASSTLPMNLHRTKKVWIWTECKEVMTTAVERGWNTFVFPSDSLQLSKDWSSVALVDTLFIDEKQVTDGTGKVVAAVFEVSTPEELQMLKIENEQTENIVLGLLDWKSIPAENLVAALQGSEKTVFAISNTPSEAKLYLEALEHGLGGIILKTEDVKAVLDLKEYFDKRNEESDTLSLTEATITRIEMVGMGDRVCVDLCSLMRPGEGLLVGSFARGLFLVHSECLESNYIASRPFRVNAGPVHAYVAVPGGRTCYLSELRTGREVIVVDQKGKQRTAVVGRVKIEKRPLILVEAKLSGEEDETSFSTILQNAETVALVTPHQVNSFSKTAVPVTSLKLGDQVLIRLQGGARHTGIEIQEFIVEN
ncbi:unnamed protein product [Brassica rapa subsp. trilocularis]